MKENEYKKRLVILDVHAILHRAYHALPDFATSKGEPTGALYGLSTMLIKIISDLKPDYIVGAYDLPKPTYRHEAFKDYKAGRIKAEDDLISQIKKSRSVFDAFNIPVYDKEGFEADDIIGTITEKLSKNENIEIVIASGDTDTLQLVKDPRVKVFTLKKGLNDTILYDEKAVKTRFGFGAELLPDYKGLRGDPSDNIPGIRGIGEVTATNLIVNFGTLDEIYKKLKEDRSAFLKVGIKERIIGLLEMGKEEAEFSKMLGTIRRDAPIDFKIPGKEWKEDLDFIKADKFFGELEFRALGARLKDAVNGKREGVKAPADGESAEPSADENPENILIKISEKDFSELSIMLWLIDSNKTKPSAEEIFEFTKTDSAEKAREILETEIKKRGLSRVFEEIEKPLIPIVLEMKKNGIKIDISYLLKLSKEYHVKLASLEKEIWEMAGSQFNIASPKQLGEILFVKMGLAGKRQKKTATGAFSTKESELEKLKNIHPIISKILEHREFSKLLSTYIDNLPALADKEGRIHGTFLQTGTTTGRMASEEPNLQNIPNKNELGRAVRKAFVSSENKVLLAFDYSQIELRIAAFLSGDLEMIRIFKSGEDVHTAVAAAVFNVPLEKVTKDERRRAKVINFGIIYGMGINALSVNLGADRKESQKFYDDYFKKFSRLAKYLDEVKAETARRGYTETLFGRRRYFEGIKSRIPYIRASAERMAINAPIQGTEADIVKLAMIKVDEFLKKEKMSEEIKLLLQVHDELVYETDEFSAKKFSGKIKEIMENIVDIKTTNGVPIKADVSLGKNWAEMGNLNF